MTPASSDNPRGVGRSASPPRSVTIIDSTVKSHLLEMLAAETGQVKNSNDSCGCYIVSEIARPRWDQRLPMMTGQPPGREDLAR